MTHHVSVHRSTEVDEDLVGSDRDLEAGGFQILDAEETLEADRDLHAAVGELTMQEHSDHLASRHGQTSKRI